MNKVLVVTEQLFTHARDILEDTLEKQGLDYCIEVLKTPAGKKKPGKADFQAFSDRLKLLTRKNGGYQQVLLAGNTPLQSVTGHAGITKLRGKPFEQNGVTYLPCLSPASMVYEPDNERLLQNDVKTLRDIVEFGGIPEEEELNIRYILTHKDFKDLLRDLHGSVSYDLETNGLYPWARGSMITQIGFGTGRHQWILPVGHHQSPWTMDGIYDMMQEIAEAFNDCYTIMHNGKFDALWSKVFFDVDLRIDFDTMLAHYLLDENALHGLKLIAQKYCGAVDWDIDRDEKKGDTSLKKLGKYLAHDVFYTRLLRFELGPMLRKDQKVFRVFKKIMMPCANIFVQIEYNGVCIDHTKFDEAEGVLRKQYNDALKALKKWEPRNLTDKRGRKIKFNWGSTQQLSRLLFNTHDPDKGEEPVDWSLDLEPLDLTAAGNPSCSESVLKRIDHPMVGALLKFREAKQQLSFFIDGWKPFLHKKRIDGKTYYFLHPSFKLHGTVTGRLSCEHPNLQQVPRDPRIRQLITAILGWELIEADLSQIELRVAAELAGEANMINAFVTGVDVHWLTLLRDLGRGHGEKELVMKTAKQLAQKSNLTYEQAIDCILKAGPDAAQEIAKEWKEFRKKAKAVNFGFLYGMWWKKFKLYARDNYGVTVTDKEAEAAREAFFELYPDFTSWHKRQKKFANKYGYVESLSGRKRRLPAAKRSEDEAKRKAAERQAINSPVQSFANDINLMALIQLYNEFGADVISIAGTVHDAILVAVRKDWVAIVYKRLLEIMSWPALFDEFDIEMEVPIEAEAKIGPWGSGQSLEKWLKAQNDNAPQKRKAA